MGFSLKLGRVAGIDLFLHWSFLLLLGWGFASGGMDYGLLLAAVFGCVVLHELGHALTARAFGIPTRDITLYPIGGVATLQRMPRAPGAELCITLAGPLVNVAIAATLGLALAVSPAFGPLAMSGYLAEFASVLLQVNLVLAAFNMIPAFPMDGGRVLRSLLAAPLGRERATEIAAGLGRALAIVFGAWALMNGSFMQVLLAVFIFSAAGAEMAHVRFDEARRRYGGRFLGGRRADEVRTAPPGFMWVSRGPDLWQLAPIPVESRPWR